MLPLGPYLTIQSTSLTEDVCRKKVAEVTVTLSSASSAPVIVEYTTIDGTAAAGEDYLPASGTLDFAPGVTSRLIRVPIRSDRVLEPDDYFSVTLTGTTGGILDETHSTAAVWIEDKPQPLICR
jgi:chitinase